MTGTFTSNGKYFGLLPAIIGVAVMSGAITIQEAARARHHTPSAIEQCVRENLDHDFQRDFEFLVGAVPKDYGFLQEVQAAYTGGKIPPEPRYAPRDLLQRVDSAAKPMRDRERKFCSKETSLF